MSNNIDLFGKKVRSGDVVEKKYFLNSLSETQKQVLYSMYKGDDDILNNVFKAFYPNTLVDTYHLSTSNFTSTKFKEKLQGQELDRSIVDAEALRVFNLFKSQLRVWDLSGYYEFSKFKNILNDFCMLLKLNKTKTVFSPPE